MAQDNSGINNIAGIECNLHYLTGSELKKIFAGISIFAAALMIFGPKTNYPSSSRYQSSYSREAMQFKEDYFSSEALPNGFKNPKTDLENVILKEYGKDPALIYAILENESTWRQYAVSPKNAAGVGQLLVSTANRFGKKRGYLEIKYPIKVNGKKYTEDNPITDPKYDWRFDPIKCATISMDYINDLEKMFNDKNFVVAAYNHGEDNVKEDMQKAGSNKFDKVFPYLPTETQHFVRKVAKSRNLYNMTMPIPEGYKFELSSEFGTRYGKPHEGIDLAAEKGTPVVSPVDGKVINYNEDGYGRRVWIEDEFGTRYVLGHLSKTQLEPGQEVKRGQLCGNVGSTGNSTGNHLHFGVYALNNGNYSSGEYTPINSTRYLLKSAALIENTSDAVAYKNGRNNQNGKNMKNDFKQELASYKKYDKPQAGGSYGSYAGRNRNNLGSYSSYASRNRN